MICEDCRFFKQFHSDQKRGECQLKLPPYFIIDESMFNIVEITDGCSFGDIHETDDHFSS